MASGVEHDHGQWLQTLGLAVGSAALVVPLYLSEIAPTEIRGAISSLNQLAIVCGILAAFLVNAALASSGEWRIMLGLAVSGGVAACGTGVPAASGSRLQAAPAANAGLARDIANIAVGKGGLAAVGTGVAWATLAVCDPGTVSHPPGSGTWPSAR